MRVAGVVGFEEGHGDGVDSVQEGTDLYRSWETKCVISWSDCVDTWRESKVERPK